MLWWPIGKYCIAAVLWELTWLKRFSLSGDVRSLASVLKARTTVTIVTTLHWHIVGFRAGVYYWCAPLFICAASPRSLADRSRALQWHNFASPWIAGRVSAAAARSPPSAADDGASASATTSRTFSPRRNKRRCTRVVVKQLSAVQLGGRFAWAYIIYYLLASRIKSSHKIPMYPKE